MNPLIVPTALRTDFSGQPDFPKDSNISDIMTQITTSEVRNKPGLKLVHEGIIKKGTRVTKFATLFEIVDHETGEFKGYDLNIWSIILKGNGYFYYNEEKKFSLNDKDGEIKALSDFLNIVYSEKLPNEYGKTYLVNQEEYLLIEKIKEFGINGALTSLIESGKIRKIDVLMESINTVSTLEDEDREVFLKALQAQKLTKQDIDILTGRKDSLEVFRKQILPSSEWTEKDWQYFFENNTWIFGYGLEYKFLRILQREAVVSVSNVSGKESVTSDFLLGGLDFTVLVELKKPTTELFSRNQNRSGSWCLSRDLIDAVSQILEQKAEWQIKSRISGVERNRDGKKITQKTIDPKAILVIGSSDQYNGEELADEIKAQTFELFRCSQRNIEIITYTELLDRATFIIEHKESDGDIY